jgi:hypothetical protein
MDKSAMKEAGFVSGMSKSAAFEDDSSLNRGEFYKKKPGDWKGGYKSHEDKRMSERGGLGASDRERLRKIVNRNISDSKYQTGKHHHHVVWKADKVMGTQSVQAVDRSHRHGTFLTKEQKPFTGSKRHDNIKLAIMKAAVSRALAERAGGLRLQKTMAGDPKDSLKSVAKGIRSQQLVSNLLARKAGRGGVKSQGLKDVMESMKKVSGRPTGPSTMRTPPEMGDDTRQ